LTTCDPAANGPTFTLSAEDWIHVKISLPMYPATTPSTVTRKKLPVLRLVESEVATDARMRSELPPTVPTVTLSKFT
jgi:hypothetical protein